MAKLLCCALMVLLAAATGFRISEQDNEITGPFDESSGPEICRLPKEKGPCKGHIPRYFFDKSTGKCERFIYGGCKGNENNFETKVACEAKCTKEESEKGCPPKEHLSECNAHCQKNCTNFNKPVICPRICVKGCVCDEGLVRGQDGKCVPPKQCPGRDVCPRGEHYDQCNAHCQRSCSTWGKPFPCPLKCEHGCVCDRGTVRGPKGQCIRPDKCPKTGESSSEEDGVGVTEGSVPEVCRLPKEVGPCDGHIPRYYYDKSTGKCESFIYGGCRGNENNFVSEDECKKHCSKRSEYSISEESSEISTSEEESDLSSWFPCPTQSGLFRNPRNCSSFIQCSNGKPNVMPCPKGLHFSEDSKRCEQPCEAYCNRTLSCKCEWKTCGLDRVCFLPKVTGPCRANMPRWFFNRRTGVCEKFTYGGCKGNKNNFEKKEDCEKRCSKSGHSEDDEISVADELLESKFKCLQDGLYPNPRNCSTFIQCSNGNPFVMNCPKELHYSEESKRCERKCEAYCNRTLSCECKWPTCGLPRTCFLSKDSGPCQASKQRYFFNKRTGQCEQFLYGGCKGNSNNFETKEACEKRCTKSTPSVCQLPKEVGPCKAAIPRYYFNKDSGRCEKFLYGGCRGNENNFPTKEECEERCEGGKGVMSEESSEIFTSEEEDEEIPGFQCPHKSGLYPNPRNCSSFIQCSNGKPNVMPCPKGLHFSEETKRCEQPCDAYCNRTLSCKCEWKTCGLPRECFLSKETGPCRANKPRFFFNKRTGQCEQFLYGGCKGNKNNFETKEACEKRCSKVGYSADEEISSADEKFEARYKCLQDGLYRNPRNCSTFIQCSNGKPNVMPCPKGLHYSEEKKRCEQPCDAYCNRTISCECKWPTCGLPRVCFLKEDSGPCHASKQRYFFNRRTGQCEQFLYGGCKGNLNNFKTKEECEKRCSKDSTHDDEISLADADVEATYKCYKDDGLFPNPRNCSSFIQCSNGKPNVMPCPKGLHYSYTTKRCEEPCKAYCNRTLSCQCKWPTCGLPDLCFLPPRTGPCRASVPRFYFNKRTGKCEKFTYGGCRGNSNNFGTKEACEKICRKIKDELAASEEVSHEDFSISEEAESEAWFRCGQDGLFRNPRNCSSFIQCSNGKPNVMPCPKGLHFSEDSKRCERPCEAYCNRTLSCSCKWPTCGLNRVCFLPKEVGPCRASETRWYFNRRTGVCEKFTYGGCKGNANKFVTKEACEKRCSKSGHSEDDEISVADEQLEARFKCLQDGLYRNPRNCSTFIQCSNGRPNVMPCPKGLHYSEESKRCEQPCEAYCNRTLSCECKWPTCGLPRTCFLSKDSGPCQASKQRYFFNKRTGQCEQFLYGGCKGNSNNFETKEACEKKCTKKSEEEEEEQSAFVNVCRFEVNQGPCSAKINMFYFDFRQGKCKKFVYGGCGGNQNRFLTFKECENTCLRRQQSEHVDSHSSEEELTTFSCPSENGDFPHPRYSEKFIRCRDNRPKVQRCPPSMTFDEHRRACVNEEESEYGLIVE